ncbi:MAG: small multi-drug export protein [Lachnospiraceae bacterium]|uniref:Small multi-drug export protein n=1 Tax=Candidatus Weimeria bifida TaxID=2599074 RepID=A0A6N7J103_9FIRM|nr:small multi-drug export protein [Candidatus Weimeria bifida]RRF96581.1 MAG: small multi-drug export protein [Lachnospiraceae bacterium]
MNAFVNWFAGSLGHIMSKEVAVFIVSLFPILECRGGLIASALLKVPVTTAVPLCVIGNILPIPFILLFIKKILHWMKGTRMHGLADWVERHAAKRSDSLKNGEFVALMLFVGIPLPGTGAWTGSLIASLLDMDLKKASIAILIGIAMATVIVASLSYGLLGAVGA